jgi:gamma-glutamyltranspeptidase/glutathione hydrolase
MSLADLARYHTVDRVPTSVGYRGLAVIGMGPPSSGGATVGEALNILERFPLGQLPRADATYDYLEASRLAFADRGTWLGDSSFFNVPLRGRPVGLVRRRARPADRAERAGRRRPRRAPDRQRARGPRPDTSASATRVGSTTNMTVTDRAGNVAEYTFTIEQTGGNGMVVPGFGFLLNNELTDFNLGSDGTSPRGANQLAAASARAPRSRRRSCCATAGRSSRSARRAARRSSRPCCRSSSTASTSG